MKKCAKCKGKCCRDDLQYRIAHMASEFYTHECEYCENGSLEIQIIVQGGCWNVFKLYGKVGQLRLKAEPSGSTIDTGFRLVRYLSTLQRMIEE